MIIEKPLTETPIHFPESDGMPMADNTKQFRWIVTIENNLEALYADDPNVFVAGDLLWYPDASSTKIRAAPDAMVVFGRPKGDRGSYLQWREEEIAPQVVFEILSPGNTISEMVRKLRFYELYGAEEYYVYDPDDGELSGWLRRGEMLEEIENMRGWISPRMGVRFELLDEELQLFRPDGEPFATFFEIMEQRTQARADAEQEREHAEQERERAEQERERAEQERERADEANALAQEERARAERAEQRARELETQLRALGIDPTRE